MKRTREAGPRDRPFRDQFENPFRSSATSLSTRATRSDPSTHAPVQDLSSQPIRSRYHFTSSRGKKRSVVPVTRARIRHRGKEKKRRVKFWTRPGRPSSSFVVSLVFLLFGAEHRPRRCPMIYTRPEKDS